VSPPDSVVNGEKVQIASGYYGRRGRNEFPSAVAHKNHLSKRMAGAFTILSMALLPDARLDQIISGPPLKFRATYKEAGRLEARPNGRTELGGNWLDMFHDPSTECPRRTSQCSSNQNLKAGRSPIYAGSRACPLHNRADYFPTLSGGASATRNKISNNRPSQLHHQWSDVQRLSNSLRTFV